MNSMKNQGLVKTIIIILAVVCIALIGLYAYKNLGDTSPNTGALSQNDIANYGQEDSMDNSSSSTEGDTYFTPSSGSDILISDNGTVEMDSIPNTLPDAPAE